VLLGIMLDRITRAAAATDRQKLGSHQ
jgi:hypothetical protein